LNQDSLAEYASPFPAQNFSVEPFMLSATLDQAIRMMDDEDVQALSAPVRDRLLQFVLALSLSFPLGRDTALAIFGDEEEEVGVLSYADRALRKQIEFSIGASTADVWMRGPGQKLDFADVTVDQVADLSILFR
jgi:hypothetical protein